MTLRKATKYPGIYSYDGKKGRVYQIRWNSVQGLPSAKTVRGSLEDAVRVKEELTGFRPRANGGRGIAGDGYYEHIDLDEIVEGVTSHPCIYVAQRKINPVIVKIGLSTFAGLGRRMAAERLHLLVAFEGARERERELHKHFDSYRCDVDGVEFFFLTKEIRSWIDTQRAMVLQNKQDAKRLSNTADSGNLAEVPDLQEKD